MAWTSWYVNLWMHMLQAICLIQVLLKVHISRIFLPFYNLCSIHFAICCIAFSIGSSSCKNKMYCTLHTTHLSKMCLSTFLIHYYCAGVMLSLANLNALYNVAVAHTKPMLIFVLIIKFKVILLFSHSLIPHFGREI